MDHKEILSHVDHTLLKPEATWPQVQALCDEAVAYGTASVCINTCYVRQAAAYLAGRCKVCCVVGFPLGAMDTASKAFEARTAIANGADEVDMVINIGRLKNEAGADYIKTSTGFSTGGATFEDVALMVKGVAGRCKVKAAGGISTIRDMETFLELGADRLGTSRAVKLIRGEQAKGY